MKIKIVSIMFQLLFITACGVSSLLNEATVDKTTTPEITPTPSLNFPLSLMSRDELKNLQLNRQSNEELGKVVALEGAFYDQQEKVLLCFYHDGLVGHVILSEPPNVSEMEELCDELEPWYRKGGGMNVGYYTRIDNEIEFRIVQALAPANSDAKILHFVGTVEMRSASTGNSSDIESLRLTITDREGFIYDRNAFFDKVP